MSFMDWVGTVAMIWLAVSILVGVVWALAGRRIFRKPPTQTTVTIVAQDNASAVLADLAKKAERSARFDGGRS